MPFIKCPMCDKDISPNAVSCPNCGEPMKEKKEIYDICNVVLVEVLNKNKNYIRIIKQIRDITNCGLKEAKDSVDKTPSTIIKNIDYSKAEDYKKLFEDLGAIIELTPLNTDSKFNEFIEVETKINHEVVIKCSNCGSVNTKKISGASKVGSVALFGIFSVGKLTKTYQCNKCGYRW
jgi:ribosomal protein L7/L12/DNA-directed RNA polymerase subunit RPC12/RpoP